MPPSELLPKFAAALHVVTESRGLLEVDWEMILEDPCTAVCGRAVVKRGTRGAIILVKDPGPERAIRLLRDRGMWGWPDDRADVFVCARCEGSGLLAPRRSVCTRCGGTGGRRGAPWHFAEVAAAAAAAPRAAAAAAALRALTRTGGVLWSPLAARPHDDGDDGEGDDGPLGADARVARSLVAALGLRLISVDVGPGWLPASFVLGYPALPETFTPGSVRRAR